MPLIAFAVVGYAGGLVTGFITDAWWPAVVSVLVAFVAVERGRAIGVAGCALIFSVGVVVARDGVSVGSVTPRAVSAASDSSVLEKWRANAGASIDHLFGTDAPVVRALLIADTRQLPAEIRDRYARSGLVHLLSISGLHVAIISGAVLLALQAMHLGQRTARWLGLAITALYVAAIGAPAPAVRSGAMLGAATLSWALQRPVSPWATLALGALVPLLLDPRTVLDLGYQLSVSGFAALVAATAWVKRVTPPDLSSWKRQVYRDFLIGCVASAASAPLVAWHFARVSLIAPVTNILAAPVVAMMQPALFLAMVLAPLGVPAELIADGARSFVRALDAIALVGAQVPGASLTVAPTLATSLLCGAATVCLLAACAARRDQVRWAAGGAFLLATGIWLPLTPRAERGIEIHMIDVGQGDAIAIRSPRGRWIVTDAGGGRGGGNAGSRIVTPYLRRLGGDVALLVMTHPHDDHVGGAATLIAQLAPAAVYDAAFAGTSASYREALTVARRRGVSWHRIRPGDSVSVDGVVATFLAPDSAWTASLTDPNLASAVVRVRFGGISILLTGDAEEPEERWLLEHAGSRLKSDILKVAHHGSSTSTSSAFLAAVAPKIALVSVGAGNRYHHPSPDVMDSLRAHGVTVLRTDLRGTIVLRTDASGSRLEPSTVHR